MATHGIKRNKEGGGFYSSDLTYPHEFEGGLLFCRIVFRWLFVPSTRGEK